MDFDEFLKSIINEDKEILTEEDFEKIPEIMCGMSNGNGGWIILEGIENIRIDEKNFSKRIEYEKYKFENAKIILKVYEKVWYEKPVSFKGEVYRRFEGENFISSKKSRMIIARDAMKYFDDEPILDKEINSNSLKQYLQEKNDLRNIYSGFGNNKHLTEAGFLLLGENSVAVKMELYNANKRIRLEANNLWKAYYVMLSRIIIPELNLDCRKAIQEIFMNALIHSDYAIKREIKIVITPKPAKITIKNPCAIIRPNRNYRLKKIFDSLIKKEIKTEKNGMSIINGYDKNFRLEMDMLNFEVRATLRIKGLPVII